MLAKEIEFPLFHLGTVPDSKGVPVTFTPELLREMEKNSTFVSQAGILHAPVKYDHPAYGAPDKENHGKMIRYQVRNNTLFAVGTNWSDRVQADKREEKRIAYSPEFVSEFEYPDPVTGTMKKIGPTVVGLSLLGSDRPAIKNLKPFSSFEFGEAIGPADEFMIRQELRSAGYVSEYCDGTHFYAEVENDARRFSERSDSEDDMDEKDFKRLLEENDKKWEDRFTKFEKQTDERVKSFSEEGKRVEKIRAFCETVNKEKPIGKLALDRLQEALTNPTEETVRAFAESLPAFIMPGGVAGEKKTGADGKVIEDDDPDEPKALASVRPKHFSDRSKHETLLAQATDDLQKIKPKLFSEAKATTVDARLGVLKQYVIEREAEAN